MHSLQEIESAIRALSRDDQAALIREFPRLLPELEGDITWQKILHDPNPSQALSQLADRVDAEFFKDPNNFPEISESQFDRHK